MKGNEILGRRSTSMNDVQSSRHLTSADQQNAVVADSSQIVQSCRRRPCFHVYLGVRDDFMRWDKELEDGVLLSWCSGVVRGPSMLTETAQTPPWNIHPETSRTAEQHKAERAPTSLWSGEAIGILNDQVIQVRRHVFSHHKLAPVICRQSQQTLHHLKQKGGAERRRQGR